MSETIVERAASFAAIAHAGQVRKYTEAPYIDHCKAVADIVACRPVDDPTDIAVAWLHDTVEDTLVTLEDIRVHFGDEVARAIWFLTDCDKSSGNREQRKAFDRGRLSAGDWVVHTVKCADLIDNTSSIVEHDPAFAKVYLREKELLLPHLDKAEARIKYGAEKVLERALETLGAD